MSFILDALKKSEQERERQQQPALMDLPMGRRSRTQPLWMIAVILLLVLNCILLLVMWWRSDATPPTTAPVATSAVTSSAAPVQQPVAQAPVVTSPPRPAEVRPLLEEAGSEMAAADETAEALEDEPLPAGPPLVRPATPLEQAMAAQESRATQLKANSPGYARGSTPSTVDNIPTLDSLGGSGALNLPPMRLDVHVYSKVPAERFVFVNTRKYSEGQSLNEGPQLERITQDGAVLNYRGQRFVLPRQ